MHQHGKAAALLPASSQSRKAKLKAAGKLRQGLMGSGGAFAKAQAKSKAEAAQARKAQDEMEAERKMVEETEAERQQQIENRQREEVTAVARAKAQKIAGEQRKVEEAALAEKKAKAQKAKDLRGQELEQICGRDAVGMFIEVWWEKEEQWFHGKVDVFAGTVYHVQYDDGDDGDVFIGKDKYRFLDQ